MAKEAPMRKSKEETAQTRETIVSAASTHIRETGLTGASVAEIMSAAGLTHGGFYRHFDNKDQLIHEALEVAAQASLENVQRNIDKGGFNAALDSYLSVHHRDASPPRCPYAALGSELARSSDEARTSVATAIAKFVTALENEGEQSHEDSVVAVATMVGALILSRITAGTALSNEFLAQSKKRLRRPTP
ncbi:TetR/AcrR family transcriptional regulator [Robbsia sp. KACC 23696]|uniref:TetR/AcrR family transcriptional regulator n=1 Tax=Robbsia sp. KACC 23696 TaxID=3149231 RepID=UPI00325ACC17